MLGEKAIQQRCPRDNNSNLSALLPNPFLAPPRSSRRRAWAVGVVVTATSPTALGRRAAGAVQSS